MYAEALGHASISAKALLFPTAISIGIDLLLDMFDLEMVNVILHSRGIGVVIVRVCRAAVHCMACGGSLHHL